VTIEILLRVTRDAGDRLYGSAKLTGGSEAREFSGMLELMRVFDDLIPPVRGEPDRSPAAAGVNPSADRSPQT
jgi:hypothetical protein